MIYFLCALVIRFFYCPLEKVPRYLAGKKTRRHKASEARICTRILCLSVEAMAAQFELADESGYCLASLKQQSTSLVTGNL